MNQVKTPLARQRECTETHHVPDLMQATIEYGKQCVYVDGVTRATLCMELFSRLHLLTGSRIPENAQMWSNGRVLRRQQTIEEMQLGVDSLCILLILLSLSIHCSVSVCLGSSKFNIFSFSCSVCYRFTHS